MATAVLPTPDAPAAASAARADADPYRNRYLIAIAVTLAAVLELVDTSIVNVAIPHMMGTLSATLDEIAWVSTSYIIANVIVIPMSSWLSAYFGRQRYLTGSIMIFVAASFFCGVATSLWGLVFWRVLQGLGGGALLSTAQTTLFESFPPHERSIGQAIFGVGVMVGPTLGPTLGGDIVDAYAWPWIFYINVPLGLVAAVLVWTYVKDVSHQVRAMSVDGLGIVLLTLAAVRALSAVLLVWRELTVKEPVIDLRVLRSWQLAPGMLFAGFLGLSLYGAVFVLPVFLQQLHGYSAQQTGLVILPGAIASAITMAVMGPAANRVDERPLITAGALLFLWAMWRLSLLSLDAGHDDFFWPLIARGVGLGMIFVPLTGASMAGLPMHKLGQGTGMFNLMRQLGGSLGIAIMATMLARLTRVEKAVLTEHAGAYDPATAERLGAVTRGLMSRGNDAATAKPQALLLLDGQIGARAGVMAFSRIYLVSGILLVCALPLLLLWRTGRTAGRVSVDGH
ncbi:MAG: MDR family MFS transporter [Gemmatimonas sp.]|uniref:MDR family MFS transporter n=1 Tax=Gemmatimonas sp. TaxID=1962908 RepID=UPI00391F9975|nr:multidrug efflux MFS transporter [Gemmatimonadota bacterium]